MSILFDGTDKSSEGRTTEDAGISRDISLDVRSELAQHIEAGTHPEVAADMARLLQAALEVEYPSKAMIDWMSHAGMHLTRNVSHRRAG